MSGYNHSKWIDPEWVSGNIEKINVTNYEWDLDLVISVCVPADLEPGYYIGQIDVRQDNNSVVVFSYGLRVSETQKESVTGAQKPVIPHEGAVVQPEPSMNMESQNAGIRSIAKNADASAFKPKPVSVRGVKEPVKVHRYEKPKMTCKAENPESGREVLQKNPKKVRQPTTRVQRIR